MNPIQTKLNEARKELLDLSLRNPLINYKPLKARGVEVVNESPTNVYRILVQDGRDMYFLPKDEADDHLLLFDDDQAENDPDRLTDNKLQTAYPSKELQRRLLNTHYTARTAIEEQGVNTLYLALGVLEWYESESSDILRRAPLVLIPVELSRASVRARFRIRYTGEDIGTNLSLQAKFKSELGIQFPDLPNVDDPEQLNVQNYCEEVDSVIRHIPRWTVDASAVAIGFFSFAKFLMYRDLDTTNWPNDALSEHSVLQAVLATSFQEPTSAIPDDSSIDEHINPAETHNVVDADSSQALAIHDVSQGRNLVIQGPPGTGKSQTITNLIAEAIAKGKRVLFVAEKMAALEVVKRNLDKVELGDACLELHSHKMNKKAVVDELKRTLDLSQPQMPAFEQELERLLANRDRLNRYCEAVNTSIGESGITPYQAYGELLAVQRRLSGVIHPALDSGQFQHSALEFSDGLNRTEELQILLKQMGIPIKHAFWGSRCNIFLPNDKVQVEHMAAEAREAIIALKDSSQQLAQHLQLQALDTREAVESVICAARRALDAPNLEGVAVQSTKWRSHTDHLDVGLRSGEQLSQLYKEYENLLNKYDGDLIDETWFKTVLEIRQVLEGLKCSSTQLAQHLKLESPDSLEAIENMIRAARYLLDAPKMEGIEVKATEWLTQSQDLETGLRAGEELSELYKEYENLLHKYDGGLIDETWFKTVLEIRQVLEGLKCSSTQLAQHLKLESPDSLEAIENMIRAARYLLDAPKMEGIEVKATEWLTQSQDLETGLRAGEQLHQLHRTFDEVLITEAWTHNVLEVRKSLSVYGPKWWRALSGKYRRARNELTELCTQQLSKSLDTQLRIVDAIRKAQREQPHFEKIQGIGKRLFGTRWRGESSNWTQLQTITKYLSELHQLIDRNVLPEELVDYLAANPDLATLSTLVSTIGEDRNRHQAAVCPFEHEIQLTKSLEIRLRVVNTILEVKRIADAIVDVQQNLEGIQELGKQLFGTHWPGDTSNWSQLQTIAQYLLVLHQSAEMDELPKKLIDYLEVNPDFERLRTVISSLKEQRLIVDAIIEIKEIVDAIIEVRQALEKFQELGNQLFGTHWQGESSNWPQLQKIGQYLLALHQLVENNELPRALVHYLAANPDLATLSTLVSTIGEDRNRHQAAVCPFEHEIQLTKSLEIQLRIVNTILEVKRIADAIVDVQQNLEGIQELGKQLFGTHWQDEVSNWTQLQTLMQYLLVLHQSTDTDELPKKLIDYLKSNSDFERLQSVISSLKAQHRIVDGIIKMKLIVDKIIEAQRELGKFQVFGKQLFGTRWQEESSNWLQLQEIAHYLSTLHQSVENDKLPEVLVEYIASNPDLEKLKPLVSTVEEHQNSHLHRLQTVVEKIQLDETVHFGTGGKLIQRPFSEQTQILEGWERESERLQDMATYNRLAKALKDRGFAEIVNLANVWPEANQCLSDLLKQAWYNAQVETAMQERPILASFNSDIHHHTVEGFRTLDRLSLECNKVKVAYEHRAHLPQHQFASGQLGALRREFAKKRRHLPIRQLMSKAGNAIQAIKPIFMMSPLSVAKFLPPNSVDFDLAVFDEASQVKPVDAFGSIIRGGQTVVVGDSLQLPPTDFFDKHIAEDDKDEDTEENFAGDMESILGLFSAQHAPERMLRWHYRSRHESLIAVSNYEFYDNRLIIFPSPYEAQGEVGLVCHHLPDTTYDRGGNRSNREEARIVAERAMDHARSHSHLTLGVATFSAPQMEAVQNELEILRRKDPSCEQTFFNAHPEEPFFVKNLENVQGDERDVIFISVGYGRDANGKLTMNFGPLNKKGGERRLNVLITRARRRCEVFTNLNGDDIDLSRTSARGVAALKRYLKYAETGELDIPRPSDRDAGSLFEEEVADALRKLGYQVDHQIGSAGYFIDLGVKDSRRAGRYLLGIECDGATYHSAQSARDRDRLRQQVLEGLGWRIHRIWSTDWFRTRDTELRKTVEAIEVAKVNILSPPEPSPQDAISGSNNGAEKSAEDSDDITPHPDPEPPSNSLAEKYKLADLVISTDGLSLHKVPLFKIAGWIQRVVEIEGPAHLNEVARRIANAVEVDRVGNRIKSAVRAAARKAAAWKAARSDGIEIRGDFLYLNEQRQVIARDRSELPNASRKLELIAPEEIGAAIKAVVSNAFGIEREELAREVCRLFSFKSVSGQMRQRVEIVVDEMTERGELTESGDSLVLA